MVVGVAGRCRVRGRGVAVRGGAVALGRRRAAACVPSVCCGGRSVGTAASTGTAKGVLAHAAAAVPSSAPHPAAAAAAATPSLSPSPSKSMRA
jgi:hypothetical protein